MKQGWKNLFSLGVIGIVATLAACGKSGGGGSSGSTSAACVYDSYGNCIAGTGSAGYVGDGSWNGRLIIQNLQLFQDFAFSNGLCYDQQCAYVSGYVGLQISLNTGGCLPGPANFSLTTYAQGYQGQALSTRGDAYMNNGNNGFMINYTSRSPYNTYGNGLPYGGYPQPNGQTTIGTLQINTQFTDAAHSVLNVQLVYRGQQIASGQVYGYARYTPGVNTANYCTGGAYGNTPYGMPYGQGGYSSYPQNPYGGYYGYGGNYQQGGMYYSPFSKTTTR